MSKSALRSGRLRWLAVVVAVALFGLLAAVGCGGGTASESTSPEPQSQVKADQLILATTTSVKDSGLLDDVVLPAFAQAQPDVQVKTVAVGSGEAMAMGQRGEADVLVVHAPSDEEQFMIDGNGTIRLPVARNYFALVGPEGDPAGVAAAADATAAMKAIADAGAMFVSRGDDSGTHKKELKLWEAAGVEPAGDWYIETGQGMGETLRITNEKQGYTLTDLGTYYSVADTVDLVVLTKETEDLANYYSVIVVNQNKFPTVNAAGAEQFANLLVSKEIQEALKTYGVEKFGKSLFIPNASSLGQ